MKPQFTRNQMLVLDALQGERKPLSAYAILDRLRQFGIRAPLQVYRALQHLTETGKVHRLESLNAFVACRHSGCDRAHTLTFAICEKCGGVAEHADARLEAEIGRIAASSGFVARRTVVEISGSCRACGA